MARPSNSYNPVLREPFRYRAARQATLTKLVGPKWTKDPIRYLYALQQIRRKRLEALKEAGCDSLATTLNMYYANRCPMFGVSGNQTGRFCRDSQLCPMCYARDYIIEPFKKMERFLYGSLDPKDDDGEHARKPAEGWRAVGFRIVDRLPATQIDEPTVNLFADWWQTAYASLRKYEFTAWRATCGVVQLQAYPQVMMKEDPPTPTIGIVRAGVFLTQHPVHQVENLTWQQDLPATKSAMCELFGKAFAFPTQLYTESPDLVVRLWRRTRKQRKLFWYCPRGPQKSKLKR